MKIFWRFAPWRWKLKEGKKKKKTGLKENKGGNRAGISLYKSTINQLFRILALFQRPSLWQTEPKQYQQDGHIPPCQTSYTAQKMKFSIKDVSSKCDQIRRKLRIWSHLLEKSLMENFIFCAVLYGAFLKST